MLEDPGFSTSNGTPVEQYQPDGGANQEWRIVSAGSGTYEIANAYSGKALQTTAGSNVNGAPVVQTTFVRAANQVWNLWPA